MEEILFYFLDSVKDLPTKKIPSSVSKLSDNKEEALLLFMEEEEKKFKGASPSWLKVPLTDKKTHYEYVNNDGLHVYYFVCLSSVKTQPKNWIEPLLEKYIREGIRIGSLNMIMWLQQRVLTFSIDEDTKARLRDGCDVTIEDVKNLQRITSRIGDTRSIVAFRGISMKVPYQTWLKQNTDLGEPSRTKKISEIKKLIERGYRIYLHAPCEYNPSDPMQKSTIIEKDLMDGKKIGALGVVMHVGKNVVSKTGHQAPEKIAIDRMFLAIRKLLDYATDTCPLILETPAGQGSELLTTFESFTEFYGRFYPSKRLKICIDTCHVWATGQDPLDYLRRFVEKFPDTLLLVHYNDSMNRKGSHIDRHYRILARTNEIIEKGNMPHLCCVGDLGHIGVRRMREIAEWCMEVGVDAVEE